MSPAVFVMGTRVVLDCDCFIINQKPYIKQLAFCVVDKKSGGKHANSHMFAFELPPSPTAAAG
ncbi:hypothetical protein RvY_12334 [Ramazzottius varieornatus]|uniref:Uncharacterized protein n=1 Tax=Ramazzottius varieornatus TaxID=947166 RepID=A0A1D1VLG4_RAMVA|nr:hypothetical protein RvY_12334 [Ramazzottius varieornatus]